MRFLSVCSGIEAASVAWAPLGWTAVAYSEIEPFPCAVLAHHYPDTPNWGDMTKYKEWPDADIDLLCGGTPCQSFSVAGLRKGLDDPRGNLMLTYLAIAGRYRPKWVVWENVPGVLSSNKGRDFGAFLGMLGQLGYGFAYRVLDAQYFGVPQRRRRVFVVGYLGDWRAAAAVLFERHSLSGHPAPSRETGQSVAGTLASRTDGGGFPGTDEACSGYVQPVHCLAHGQGGAELGIDRAPTLTCNHEAPIVVHGTQDPCVGDAAFALGRNSGQENAVAYAVRTANTSANGHGISPDIAHTLDRAQGQAVAYSVALRGREGGATAELGGDVAGCLRASTGGGDKPHVLAPAIAWSEELTAHIEMAGTTQRGGAGGRHDGVMQPDMQVRRLTPVECEKLQGFPEGYTNIKFKGKPVGDGHRYKALGNSWATPNAQWIGRRIDAVSKIMETA